MKIPSLFKSFHEDSANYQTLPANAAKPTADVTKRSTSQNILDLYILDFLDELAEVVQLFAIYFSKRDDNLLKYLVFLLVSLWMPTNSDAIYCNSRSSRCMNCETDFAVYDCAHERYVDSLLDFVLFQPC